jgi:hypothetical protein
MFRFNVKVSSMMFGADESGIEPIHFLTENSTVLFVRLMPLVGG